MSDCPKKKQLRNTTVEIDFKMEVLLEELCSEYVFYRLCCEIELSYRPFYCDSER